LNTLRRGKRRQRQRTDVEEDVVQRRTARAPLDRHAGEREWQCRTKAEKRCGRKTTHGADREHRRSFVRLERKSLAHSDEPHDGEQTQ